MADRMRGSLLAQRKPLDWWRIDASRVLRIGGRLLFVEPRTGGPRPLPVPRTLGSGARRVPVLMP
jgi:hypothetical protein